MARVAKETHHHILPPDARRKIRETQRRIRQHCKHVSRWVKYEARHDVQDWIRFWVVEFVLLACLNFDTMHAVQDLAKVWPW